MSHIQIVNQVMHIVEGHHPWKADQIERLEVHGHTPSGVRVSVGTLPGVTARPGQTVINRPDHLVHCLPDDFAWADAQHVRDTWQHALDALADELRAAGRYDLRLAEAGKGAPNPLVPTVAYAVLPPDRYYAPVYAWNGDVPTIIRASVEHHTPKMIKLVNHTPIAQTHGFCCPDAAAWRKIEARIAEAKRAREAWLELLKRLGTYQEARKDGRYSALQPRLALL